MFTIKTLRRDDLALFDNVASDVFDHPIDKSLALEFLQDPRHHIVVAIADGMIVGFASAVHYIHPDKPPELWINEVGVAPSRQKQGIAKAILKALLQVGHELGCKNAWVLTDRHNEAANHLYRSTGGQISDENTIMYEFKITED